MARIKFKKNQLKKIFSYKIAFRNALKMFFTGGKVDFIVAGVQKAGTTALDSYLRKHKQICMPYRKEIHFFDRDRYFFGFSKYFLYHTFFSPDKNKELLGEVTPIYSFWNNSFERMWKYNPKMKIIIILRNPVERAYSHWNMETQLGNENQPFLKAIKTEDQRSRISLPKQHRIYSYKSRGFYSCQIKELWRFYPKNQTLILKHDDLYQQPNETMKQITNFLGVKSFQVEEKKIHARSYKAKISKKEKKFLIDIYKFEIKEIESMLNWDCSEWLKIS